MRDAARIGLQIGQREKSGFTRASLVVWNGGQEGREGEGMISGMRCKKDTPFGGAAGGRGPVGPRSQKESC